MSFETWELDVGLRLGLKNCNGTWSEILDGYSAEIAKCELGIGTSWTPCHCREALLSRTNFRGCDRPCLVSNMHCCLTVTTYSELANFSALHRELVTLSSFFGHVYQNRSPELEITFQRTMQTTPMDL